MAILSYRRSKEYNEGYQAAIEAIKKLLEEGNDPDDAADNADDDLENPNHPKNKNPEDNNGDNESGGGQNDGDNESGGGDSELDMSRDSKEDSNQGVVRPEDCIGPDDLDDVPETPGSIVDKDTGDKIAKEEGYDDKSPSESRTEQEWKDAALKISNEGRKRKGKNPGNDALVAKIDNLYKPAKDWKKSLKKIVGYAISPEDFRLAYANKNVLVSQDRLARTDKQKYDSLDYIITFIDSSGSMSDELLKICLSEVYNMALQKKPMGIYVIQCDTVILDIKYYNSVPALKKDIKRATVKGRGGTDFKPCWELLKNDKRFKGRQAELVMLFTDGYCDQYKRDPRTMGFLCWTILNNPGFLLQFKDPRSSVVYINTSDIKK